MGQQDLIKHFRSEAELVEFAGVFARSLRAGQCHPLVVGLRGDLGCGKTTWARAMLRGLGYAGRVPSPTYTLLEQYLLDGLTVVHLDLYRLSGDEELENLGLRDWLAELATWVLVEWPERAPRLAERCDLSIEFVDQGGMARRLVFHATTAAGIRVLEQGCHGGFNNDP
jgi:tRNA threonylcarbamoyladenosine biosynthesis protein TsaE